MARRITALTSGLVFLALLIIHGPEVTRPVLAAPPNDSFAIPVTITTPTYSGIVATGSNVGATGEPGEPLSCNPPAFGATVWYSWTSPASPGTVVFDTHGSNFDTVLSIYTGSAVNALTRVACNDDFLERPSTVALSYAASTTYWIQLSGFSGATGDFVLNMSTGAVAVVSNATDSNSRDLSLSLREAIMLASGALAFGSLDSGEQSSVQNGAAAGVSGSDLIFFAQPFAFPVGMPVTITLAGSMNFLSANGDTVSGIGAGVIINGNGIACFTVTGNFNRIEGLDVRNCTFGGVSYAVYISGNNNWVGGSIVPAQGMVISGSDYGIYIEGAGDGAASNVVQGSFIGLSRTGAALAPNGSGIALTSLATFTLIGGGAPAQRNVISNNFMGIHVRDGISHDTLIWGNYIGTGVSGNTAVPNTRGIELEGASQVAIGGNFHGSGNVISGNSDYGVRAVSLPSDITITGNLIGTDFSAADEIPNGGGIGIVDGQDIRIGGLTLEERNLISGNLSDGVFVTGQATLNTRILGNYIGSNLAGTGAIANFAGVEVVNASGVLIGGASPGQSNLISGNVYGARIISAGQIATSNIVAGNLIGTNASGAGALANGIGVEIVDAVSNAVGGTSAGARNIIAGNTEDGVRVRGLSAHSNTIIGNFIGLGATGAELRNGDDGIDIVEASRNTIGGETAAERNVISGNDYAGIHVIGAPRIVRTFTGIAPINDVSTTFLPIDVGISNPIVDLDVEIDLNHTWDEDLDIFLIPPVGPSIELTTDNGSNGDDYRVTLFDDEASTSITAGTPPFNGSFRPEAPLSALDGMNPAGTWYLQVTDDAGADIGAVNSWSLKFAVGGNRVLGNYIGTDATGSTGIYNARGIWMSNGARFNTIGGGTSGARNVISGSSTYGIQIESGSTDNLVQGNYIGTAANGTSPVGNLTGIYVLAPRNQIGGTAPGARNVISGNATAGITFEGAGTILNVVEGNYIGVGADGVTAVPNGFWGITTNSGAHSQVIGGEAAGAGNLIARNGQYGIWIQSDFATVYGNTVRNNSQHGIAIAGSGNGVGGTSPGQPNAITANGGDGLNVYGGGGGNYITANTISGNGGDGVDISAGGGNRVGTNSISGNGGLGIDLGSDGVSQNDPGDPDPGANLLQNYPVLTAVNVNTGFGETTISGTFDSVAGDSYTLSFFENNTCDATAHGEGGVFIGSGLIGGSSIFAVTVQVEVPPGRFITATATRLITGDTSEFSNCVPSAADADDDNDGFDDIAEASIGTGSMDPCGNNGWPADLDPNNALTIGDLNSFLVPLRGDGSFNKLNHPVPDPDDGDIARWNLQTGGTINIGDLNALNPGVNSPTSRPPMFGGLPAFFTDVGNGIGRCPFPP